MAIITEREVCHCQSELLFRRIGRQLLIMITIAVLWCHSTDRPSHHRGALQIFWRNMMWVIRVVSGRSRNYEHVKQYWEHGIPTCEAEKFVEKNFRRWIRSEMCGKLLNEMIVADCADRVHGCFYEHQYARTGQINFYLMIKTNGIYHWLL